MNVDKATIKQAVIAISAVEGIWMKPKALVQDSVYLTLAFPEQEEYKTAIANTVKALKGIVANSISAAMLNRTFKGWESYHYQPKVGQRVPADMRIVFKREDDGVHVLGFGHRYTPVDLYRRVSASKNERV